MSLDKYYINTYGKNAMAIYHKSKEHYDSIIGTSNRKNSNKKINTIVLQKSAKRQHQHLKIKELSVKKCKNSHKKQKIQTGRKQQQRYSYCSACSPPPFSPDSQHSTTTKIQKMLYKLQQKTTNKKIDKKCSKHSQIDMPCIYQLTDIFKKIQTPNILKLFKEILENALVSIENLERKVYELQQLNTIYQKNIELLNNRLCYEKSHHYSLNKSFSLPQPQNQRQMTFRTHIDSLQKQLQIYRNNQQNLFTAIHLYTDKPSKISNNENYSHNLQQDNLEQYQT